MGKYLLVTSLLLLSCLSKAQCPISVTVLSVPDVSVTPACKNTPIQLTATPDSLGTIVTQYVWVVGTDTLVGNSATVNVLANNQNVTVYMETTTGCPQDTVSSTFLVQAVILTSTVVPVTTECNQTVADVQVSTITTGNSTSFTYEILGVGTSSDGFYNDVATGTYSIYTTDGQGCKDTTQATIVSFDCPPPAPTDRITPNEDGFNDTWQIINIQFYPDNEVFIYDRWGQRVYHKNGYDNVDGWDAKYIGVDMPVSTYYYLLEIKPENGGEEIIMRGPISVFR